MRSLLGDGGKLQGRKSKSTTNETQAWLNSVPKPATKRKVKKKALKISGARQAFQTRTK